MKWGRRTELNGHFLILLSYFVSNESSRGLGDFAMDDSQWNFYDGNLLWIMNEGVDGGERK
jgi:hypothetical protein